LGEEKSFFAEGLADALFNPSGEALPVTKKDQESQGSAGKKGGTGGKKANGPGLSGALVQPTQTPGTAAGAATVPTVAPTPISSGQ
jgi:hypothetical protein